MLAPKDIGKKVKFLGLLYFLELALLFCEVPNLFKPKIQVQNNLCSHGDRQSNPYTHLLSFFVVTLAMKKETLVNQKPHIFSISPMLNQL